MYLGAFSSEKPMPERRKPKIYQEAIDAVKDIWRKGSEDPFYNPFNGDPPLPPSPSIFQGDPRISITDPDLAQLIDQLLNIDPHAKSRVKSIQSGPAGATMRDLMADGFGPDEMDKTNLLGGYAPREGTIAINPYLAGDPEEFYTIVHELGHAAGRGEEGADEAMNVMKSVARRKGREGN